MKSVSIIFLSLIFLFFSVEGLAQSKMETEKKCIPTLTERWSRVIWLSNEYASRDIVTNLECSIPKFDNEIQKIKFVIAEFHDLLRDNKSFTKSRKLEMEEDLAGAYGKLAYLIKRDAQSKNDRFNDLDAQIYYANCFQIYENLLLKSEVKNKYYVGTRYVDYIIASENYELALSKIKELKVRNFKRIPFDSDQLIRREADIYFLQEKYEKAGKKYDEWINKGVEIEWIKIDLIERFEFLRKRTGFPTSSTIMKIK
jgi:tetratricopeptide (TPR) repeat protein